MNNKEPLAVAEQACVDIRAAIAAARASGDRELAAKLRPLEREALLAFPPVEQ